MLHEQHAQLAWKAASRMMQAAFVLAAPAWAPSAEENVDMPPPRVHVAPPLERAGVKRCVLPKVKPVMIVVVVFCRLLALCRCSSFYPFYNPCMHATSCAHSSNNW